MRVSPILQIDVKIQCPLGHQGLKKVFKQTKVEILYLTMRELDVIHEEWTATQINHDFCQGLIEGNDGPPKPTNLRLLTQGFLQGGAKDLDQATTIDDRVSGVLSTKGSL